MVTGQSCVLHSRLHLVVRNRLTLRLILIMIVWNAITLHTPTIVLTIGSNGPNGEHWAPIFNIMERIQLALFCVQELTISTVYIVYTVRLLGSIYHSKTRHVMFELIVINSICLGMDVILIGLEYSNKYVGETSIKPMLYAIKLKLEFAVLNQLVGLTRAGLTEGNANRQTRPTSDHALRHRGSNLSGDGGLPFGGMTRVFRGSVRKEQLARPIPPDQIFEVKDVEVMSEPKSQCDVRNSIVIRSRDRKDRSRDAFDVSKPLSMFSHIRRLPSDDSGFQAINPPDSEADASAPSEKR